MILRDKVGFSLLKGSSLPCWKSKWWNALFIQNFYTQLTTWCFSVYFGAVFRETRGFNMYYIQREESWWIYHKNIHLFYKLVKRFHLLYSQYIHCVILIVLNNNSVTNLTYLFQVLNFNSFQHGLLVLNFLIWEKKRKENSLGEKRFWGRDPCNISFFVVFIWILVSKLSLGN